MAVAGGSQCALGGASGPRPVRGHTRAQPAGLPVSQHRRLHAEAAEHLEENTRPNPSRSQGDGSHLKSPSSNNATGRAWLSRGSLVGLSLQRGKLEPQPRSLGRITPLISHQTWPCKQWSLPQVASLCAHQPKLLPIHNTHTHTNTHVTSTTVKHSLLALLSINVADTHNLFTGKQVPKREALTIWLGNLPFPTRNMCSKHSVF